MKFHPTLEGRTPIGSFGMPKTFRVKNYRKEFFARKPVGLNSQVLPSELTL